MKKFFMLLLALVITAGSLSAQGLKDGRIVLSYIDASVDEEMIDQWDTDVLTPKEKKMHEKWKERLKMRLQTRIVENCDVILTDKGADLQPLNTILKVQNKMQNELSTVYEEGEYFPNLLFPKKVLKKSGESADVGEHFVSLSFNLYKPKVKKIMKGYKPVLEMKAKVFSKNGDLVTKITKELEGPNAMFYIDRKNRYTLEFNKIDDSSIDWIFEEFGETFDKLMVEVIEELL